MEKYKAIISVLVSVIVSTCATLWFKYAIKQGKFNPKITASKEDYIMIAIVGVVVAVIWGVIRWLQGHSKDGVYVGGAVFMTGLVATFIIHVVVKAIDGDFTLTVDTGFALFNYWVTMTCVPIADKLLNADH